MIYTDIAYDYYEMAHAQTSVFACRLNGHVIVQFAPGSQAVRVALLGMYWRQEGMLPHIYGTCLQLTPRLVSLSVPLRCLSVGYHTAAMLYSYRKHGQQADGIMKQHRTESYYHLSVYYMNQNIAAH
jgi:hypothetical protein